MPAPAPERGPRPNLIEPRGPTYPCRGCPAHAVNSPEFLTICEKEEKSAARQQKSGLWLPNCCVNFMGLDRWEGPAHQHHHPLSLVWCPRATVRSGFGTERSSSRNHKITFVRDPFRLFYNMFCLTDIKGFFVWKRSIPSPNQFLGSSALISEF